MKFHPYTGNQEELNELHRWAKKTGLERGAIFADDALANSNGIHLCVYAPHPTPKAEIERFVRWCKSQRDVVYTTVFKYNELWVP